MSLHHESQRRVELGSRRLQAVQSAMVPAVEALVAAYPGSISLGQGMVAYGPPPEALERLAGFGSAPEHHQYGSVPGEPELIAALGDKLRSENGIEIDERRFILVTAGSNMAFFQAVLTIADPGDEIVLLAPFYFNHEMAVRIAGCSPVAVAVAADRQPDPDAIEAAITERTRAVVTISPNNPTGAVYRRDLLEHVNGLCRERGVYHVSDEAYEYFVYADHRHVSPGSFADAADHTITTYSLSKAYGFAGWRIGYAVFPAALQPALLKVQDTNPICPPVVSQHVALGALEAGPAYCRGHLVELAATRELVLEELAELGTWCARPFIADGAFYTLLELDTSMSDWDVNERLVRDFGVAALPGSTFGMEDRCTLRVSYGALDRATAADGIGRLVRGLRTIIDGQA